MVDIKKLLLFILAAVFLFLPSGAFAAYTATFTDSVSSANVGSSFTTTFQVTNSSGSGSGTGTATLTVDSDYFSTSDSLSKTCSFGGANTCSASWALQAIKAGTKGWSATATIGSDSASGTHSSITISAAPSYVLSFTENEADNILSGGEVVTFSLTVTNNGGSASPTATISYSSSDFSLTAGSATVSLGTINQGGQATTSWQLTAASPVSSSSPQVTVTVTGGGATSTSTLTFTKYTSSQNGTSGTGGTGGTGGAGAETAAGQVSESQVIASIAAGSTAKVTLSKADDIKIQEIQITTVNAVNNVQLTFTKSSTLPSTVSAAPSGKVYNYITIDKQNIRDADVSSVKIKFKVEKSWLTANNVDENTVKLNRYTTSWQALSTTKLSFDTTNVYYEATSPGLSVFAISGQQKAVVPTNITPTNVTKQTQPAILGVVPGKTETTTLLIVIVAIIAIVTTAILYAKSKKKHVHHIKGEVEIVPSA